jgi:uncharacterized membrane protein
MHSRSSNPAVAGDSLSRTMSPGSSSQGSVRSTRRSVSWYARKEYVNGALWVLPTAAAVGFTATQRKWSKAT